MVLIRDEAGVVLLSHPIKWQSSGNVIELFHASNFLATSVGDKYTISLQSRENFDGNKPISRLIHVRLRTGAMLMLQGDYYFHGNLKSQFWDYGALELLVSEQSRLEGD